MPLSRWLLLIAFLVILGCLQVAQHTGLYVKAYGVGKRAQQVHAEEVDVSWLMTRVASLSSPPQLASLAQERQLNLVAWSTLPNDQGTATPVQVASLQSEESD